MKNNHVSCKLLSNPSHLHWYAIIRSLNYKTNTQPSSSLDIVTASFCWNCRRKERGNEITKVDLVTQRNNVATKQGDNCVMWFYVILTFYLSNKNPGKWYFICNVIYSVCNFIYIESKFITSLIYCIRFRKSHVLLGVRYN